MKYTLLTALASMAMVVAGYSATTIGLNSGTVSGGVLATGGVIVNSSGSVLTSTTGFYSLAYVTSGSLNVTASTTASQLLSQLSLTGSTVAFSGTTGFLNGSITNADPGNTLINKQIYVLIGNNNTILSSSAAALYTFSTLFPTQDGAGNATGTTIPIRTDAGLVFGAKVPATNASGPFVSANGVNQVAISSINSIPEPSAALLGGLGLLGLLRRRR